jgi:hypothetical protein
MPLDANTFDPAAFGLVAVSTTPSGTLPTVNPTPPAPSGGVPTIVVRPPANFAITAKAPIAGAPGAAAGPAPTAAPLHPLANLDPAAFGLDPTPIAPFPTAAAGPAAIVGPISPIGGSAADVAAHAMTLGADDVVVPAIGASMNYLLRQMIPGAPQASWSDDYARLQTEQRTARHAYEAASPIAAAGAGVIGSLATPGIPELFGAGGPATTAASRVPLATTAAPTVLDRATAIARGIAAGATLGGAAGFGESEGDISDRLGAAKTGAEMGGVLSAAAPLVSAGVGAAGRLLAPVTRPIAQIVSPAAREAAVAANLERATGGAPIVTSPTGPLDIAQATNAPAAAAKVQYAATQGEFAPEAGAMRDAQIQASEAKMAQLGTLTAPPQASAAVTNAIREAYGTARNEERRLWTVPKLAGLAVHPDGVQQEMNAAVAALDPVLRDSMSPRLRALVNRTNKAGMTTVRDLNGIRSDLEQIARTSPDGTERMIARTLSNAFMGGLDKTPEIAGAPTGVPTGRTTYARDAQGILRPVPEMSAPIAPDPEITQAHQTARDYTRRMRTLFADKQMKQVLHQVEGVYQVDPSQGAARFFDLAKGGIEGPQSIAELAAFIDTLRAQPNAPAVAAELRDTARSFVASSLAEASKANVAQKWTAQRMGNFLRVNGPWIERSGLFTAPQVAAARDLMDYASLLQRTEVLKTWSGSQTQPLFRTGETFTDQIMRPWVRRLAEMTATLGGLHVGGEVGAAAGVAASAAFEGAVRHAENAMRELMASAVLDSRVAADLQQRVSARAAKRLSPRTMALIQRLSAQLPSATGVPLNVTPTTPAAGAQQ